MKKFLQESDFGDGDGENQWTKALEELENYVIEYTRSYNDALADVTEKYFNLGAGAEAATGTSFTTQRFQQRAYLLPGTLAKSSYPLEMRHWLECFWLWLVAAMGELAANGSAVDELRLKLDSG